MPDEHPDKPLSLGAAPRKARKINSKIKTPLKVLTYEVVPIDSIRPNSYNPNRMSEHNFELLLRSMEEDGFTMAIVVLADSTIVDGEHRWRAAHKLGYTQVPVARFPEGVDITQAKLATLRHNRAHGEEDIEIVSDMLRDLQALGELGWAQDSLMLSDVEVERLLGEESAAEALASADFGDAWVPDPTAPYRGATTEAQEEADNELGATVSTSSTPAAIEAMRAQEKRITAAKTEEDRAAIRKESKFFRVSVLFEGEDAELVKRVLGQHPAEKLLAYCKADDASH